MTMGPSTTTGSTLAEAHLMAGICVPTLVVYAAAQTGISLTLGRDLPGLKLMLEPFLLLLGATLHVLWRRVTLTYYQHDLPRPAWMAACDCASFVTTFWALYTLAEAFVVQAKVL